MEALPLNKSQEAALSAVRQRRSKFRQSSGLRGLRRGWPKATGDRGQRCREDAQHIPSNSTLAPKRSVRMPTG